MKDMKRMKKIYLKINLHVLHALHGFKLNIFQVSPFFAVPIFQQL